MDMREKPAIRAKRLVIKCAALLILLCCGAALLYGGIANAMRYERLKDSGVTVEAVISRVKENYDSDSGTDYDIYADYTYEGKKYSILYDTSGSSKSMNRIGETVSVVVNPENPREKITSIAAKSAGSGLVGIAFLCIGIAMLHFPVRYTYAEAYSPSRDCIQIDLLAKVRGEWGWHTLLLFGLALIAMSVAFPLVFKPGVCWPIGLIVAALGIWLGKRHFTRLGKVQQMRYSIRQDVLQDKRVSRDSDGDTTYTLVYGGNGGSWTHYTSYTKYQAARIGQCVTAVYLEGETSPIIKYADL